MTNLGYVRIAAASPKIKVANPEYNKVQILEIIHEAERLDAAILVLPELSLTGYTCGDLFYQKTLQSGALDALQWLLDKTAGIHLLTLVGIPVVAGDKLYNCAAAIFNGQLLGLIPKKYVPNYKEFYEKRWFSPWNESISRHINLLGCEIPFGSIIFESTAPSFVLGAEICEDLWAPIPPSSYLTLAGANIIANLSASNELVAKSTYRRQLLLQQSARSICAYAYASAGVHESSTDLVFSGECVIAENGILQAAGSRFSRENQLTIADIDIDCLNYERQYNKSFSENPSDRCGERWITRVVLQYGKSMNIPKDGLRRKIARNPFVPEDPATVNERCEEIFQIQVAGLAKRIEHTGSQKAVLGISGGLDSTLALLVTKKTFDLLQRPAQDIVAVTMPGFGTTDMTHENALELMRALGVSIMDVDIRKACLQQFADLGHDAAIHDVTYENVQARQRTQLLMNLANKVQGLVVGTGDLSELALGWCTYNGDHMSMYGVNSGVPKTLVKFLVKWVAETLMTKETGDILRRILDTPITPELLPPDPDGRIRQKTENLIGPYELHDFFLYYAIRYGLKPEKILYLAVQAYGDKYPEQEIKKWLQLFYRRFFSQQFKRSCLPDGPKVGSVSLSPRGDWRMPSDASAEIWLKELD